MSSVILHFLSGMSSAESPKFQLNTLQSLPGTFNETTSSFCERVIVLGAISALRPNRDALISISLKNFLYFLYETVIMSHRFSVLIIPASTGVRNQMRHTVCDLQHKKRCGLQATPRVHLSDSCALLSLSSFRSLLE